MEDRQIELIENKQTIYVCNECGSREVEEQCWCKVNSREVIESNSIMGKKDYWCPECQENCEIVDINEYKTTTK